MTTDTKDLRLGLLVADARILLKEVTQQPGWQFFDQVVQFDPKDENKIVPINDVFLKKDVYKSGTFGVHWDICRKNSDGEDERVVIGGPLCMSSSLFVNKFGNFGIDMSYAPDTEAKASYWFEMNGQSYYEADCPNEHLVEFCEWWKRVALWGFKTAMDDAKFTISWKDTLKQFEKFEGKTVEQWTPADWRQKCDEVARFAPINVNKNGEKAPGLEAKAFFEKNEKTGEKRKVSVRSPIPEIAAVEEKYGVSYNNIPVYRYDPKIGLVALTDQEKWEGKFLRRDTVYWPFFTATLADNARGLVNLKLRLNKLVVVGRAKCPLPEFSGPRTIRFKADESDPKVQEFIRKQAEAEAMEAFQMDAA